MPSTQGTGGRTNVGSDAVTQFNDPRGVHVPWEQMQAGNLVIFDNLDHLGIYMGGGRFVHAPHTGHVVRGPAPFLHRSAVRYVQ